MTIRQLGFPGLARLTPNFFLLCLVWTQFIPQAQADLIYRHVGYMVGEDTYFDEFKIDSPGWYQIRVTDLANPTSFESLRFSFSWGYESDPEHSVFYSYEEPFAQEVLLDDLWLSIFIEGTLANPQDIGFYILSVARFTDFDRGDFAGIVVPLPPPTALFISGLGLLLVGRRIRSLFHSSSS